MASSPFCDFFSLGAGVTPAEGNVKPTAGFTFNYVNYSYPLISAGGGAFGCSPRFNPNLSILYCNVR
jgi:hypothetical protein